MLRCVPHHSRQAAARQLSSHGGQGAIPLSLQFSKGWLDQGRHTFFLDALPQLLQSVRGCRGRSHLLAHCRQALLHKRQLLTATDEGEANKTRRAGWLLRQGGV